MFLCSKVWLFSLIGLTHYIVLAALNSPCLHTSAGLLTHKFSNELKPMHSSLENVVFKVSVLPEAGGE